MIHRRWFGPLVLVCILAAGSAFGQDSWLEPRHGDSYVFLDTAAAGSPVSVDVPLLLEDGVERVEFRLLSVFFDGVSRGDLEPHLELAFAPEDERRGPALVLRVDAAAFASAGDYELQLEAVDRSPAAPGAAGGPAVGIRPPLELALTLRHPAAVLGPLPPLTVERITHPLYPPALRWLARWTWLPAASPEVIGGALVLRETGGRSRITDIRFQPLPVGDAPERYSGTIAAVAPAEIAPDEALQIGYELVGRFPRVGASSGSIDITAPQLAQAVQLGYTVRARLARWVLVVVILAGLLLGFLVRVVLRSRRARLEARLPAYELRDDLLDSRRRYPDATFRSATDTVLASLGTALRKRNAAGVAAAVAAAKSEADAALADLHERAAAATESADRLVALARGVAPAMPPALERALHATEEAVARARTDLGAYRVARAQAALAEIEAALVHDLAAPLDGWVLETTTLLGDDGPPFPDPPQPLDAATRTRVQALLERLGRVVPERPAHAWTLEDLRAALERVAEARRELNRFTSWLAESVTMYAGTLLGRLAPLPLPAADALASLRTEVDGFVADLDGRDTPERRLRFLAEGGIVALNGAFDAGLRAQIASSWPQGTRDEIAARIDARRYLEAAERIREALREAARVEGTPLGGEAGSELEATFEGWTLAPAEPVPGVPRGAEVGRAQRRLEELPSTRRETAAQLTTLRGVEYLLSAGVILGVGYVLFQGSFVGTPEELLGIFAWAFGLDVSTETIGTLLRANARTPEG